MGSGKLKSTEEEPAEPVNEVEPAVSTDNDKEKDVKETIVKEENPPPVPFLQLFKYSTAAEKLLIFIGLVAAVIAGLAMPALTIFYGDLTNAFVYQAKTEILQITNWRTVGNLTHTIADMHDNVLSDCSNIAQTIWELMMNCTDTKGTLVRYLDLPGLPKHDEVLTDTEFTKKIRTFSLNMTYVGIGNFITGYIFTVVLVIAAERQIFRIRNRFLRAVLRQDIGWYDTHSTGDFASRSTEDLDKLVDGMGDKLGMIVMFVSTFVFSVINAFVHGWKLTLVMLAVFPLLAVAMGAISRVQATYVAKELRAYGAAGAIADEVFSSIRTVVAFGGEAKEAIRYEKKLGPAKTSGIRRTTITAIGGGMIWLVIYCAYALAFWFGIKLIIEESDTYTAGKMITIFFSVMMGAMVIGRAAPFVEALGASRSAASFIYMILDRVPVIDSLSEEGLKPSSIEGDIELTNTFFKYPSRPDVQILHGLSLKIKKGETVALVGSSGCGKSTVVQLIQRFYDPEEGEVKLDGTDIKKLNVGWLREQIGVVGQEPVLFATTIRENIRHGKSGATDDEIVHAAKQANAHDFIMKLPKNYETLVGDRGTQLSGGQKQRIAIARALVRDPHILLLDEATSALDTQSESIVQEALDKASKGRTTIIIAHRLSTVRNADRIVAVKDGVVFEEGNHDELMKKQGLYHQLVTLQMVHFEEDNDSEDDDEILSVSSARNFKTQQSVLSKLSKDSDTPAVKSTTATVRERAFSFPNDIDEEEEELKPSLMMLLRLNRPEWHILGLGVLGSFIMGFSTPGFSILFGSVMNIMQKTEHEMRVESQRYAWIFVLVGVGTFSAAFFMFFFLGVAGEFLTLRVRKLLFSAILKQEVGWFDDPKNSTGALCSKLASDAASLKGAGGSRIGTILQAIATLTASVVVALCYQWKLALVTSAVIPLLLLATYLQGKLITGQAITEAASVEDASKGAIEAISNIRTVASLGKEKYFCKLYEDSLTRPHIIAKRKAHLRGIVYGFAQSTQNFVYAGAMYYGGYLIRHENISYSTVFKVSQLIIMGTAMTGQSLSFAPDYNKGLVAASRIIRLLDRKSKIDASSQAGLQLPKDTQGTVQLKNVHFRYPQRRNVKVLRGLNMDVLHGQTVALVGSSGCGKSTCIQLLERFYDPLNGTVEYSQKDTQSLNLSNMRTHFGLVSQEPTLFGMTIAENIAYGDNSRVVPMEEIIEAAKNANIHNFISSLPNGYQTELGDKGTQLSGGQKQRVAIARALVRNPKVLLLDEATSALDTESEKVVQDALDKARAGRTCITIAHRLSTIQNADVIICINNGRIVEQGTHSQLLSKKGLYYTLHKRQGAGGHAT